MYKIKNIYIKIFQKKKGGAFLPRLKPRASGALYGESQGGHLVTITSFEEQQVIEKLLREDGIKNHYWLGAYRSKDGHEYKKGQSFKWVTGEESNFSKFSPDQPDNYHNIENYLMIYRNSNFGEWNDITVDGTVDNYGNFGIRNFGFICEWES